MTPKSLTHAIRERIALHLEHQREVDPETVGGKSLNVMLRWRIAEDKAILKLLEDDRSPLFALLAGDKEVVGPFPNQNDATDWGAAFIGDRAEWHTWHTVAITDPDQYAAEVGELCTDHWHCDPRLTAHDCSKPDRTKPCPRCGDTGKHEEIIPDAPSIER